MPLKLDQESTGCLVLTGSEKIFESIRIYLIILVINDMSDKKFINRLTSFENDSIDKHNKLLLSPIIYRKFQWW